MRLTKAERRVFDHVQALAGLGLGPELALSEAALALGGGPFGAFGSVVAIARADMKLGWSFADAPAFDAHVWPYFARLGRIERIRRKAALAIEFAASMPVLSTADFPQITRRTTIYRELMVPCGVEHILRLLVPGAGAYVYSFAFGRARKAPAFTARDKALALALLPHLGRAAEAGGGAAEGEHAAAAEAFLLFGQKGTAPDKTDGADQMLRLTGGGGAEGYAAGLEQAEGLAAGESGRGGAAETRNAFGRFEFRAQKLGEGGRTVVAVRRAIPAAALALRAAARLDLPLRQMELAARLAGGATMEAASADLGLSLNTARNYTRLVYARLGLDGREALARALIA